jgi:hypothetical protein
VGVLVACFLEKGGIDVWAYGKLQGIGSEGFAYGCFEGCRALWGMVDAVIEELVGCVSL